MNRYLLSLIFLIFGFCTTIVYADNSEQMKLKAEAKLSETEAQNIALTKVPNGAIVSSELEREKGKLVWSFDISKPYSKHITEILIDAQTGRIISRKTETPIEQAKEAAADNKESQQ